MTVGQKRILGNAVSRQLDKKQDDLSRGSMCSMKIEKSVSRIDDRVR